MALTNFIPQVWSARLLDHLDKNHVYANLVNRYYEGDITDFGDTVKINQLGAVTIGDYTKDTDMGAVQTLSGAQVLLSIDQAKYFNFQIDDIDKAQTNPKLMDAAMQRAAYGLADATDSYIASLHTAVPAGNKIGDDSTAKVFDGTNGKKPYDFLVDAATLLDEANVPPTDRFVVVPPWVRGLLRKDDRFVSGSDLAHDTLKTGYIGMVAGMEVYVSNNVPNTGGAKYKIIASHPMAITYAEQIVSTEAYRPESRFADAMKGLHVYGAKACNPNALVVITASKS